MDFTKTFAELRQEHEQIERAILSLERLGGGTATDTIGILGELRERREQIEEAFLSLDRLARSRGMRRGRPPAWMSRMAVKRRGRPPGSKNRTKAAE